MSKWIRTSRFVQKELSLAHLAIRRVGVGGGGLRGGIVVKAHRLAYHSNLGWIAIKKKKKGRGWGGGAEAEGEG